MKTGIFVPVVVLIKRFEGLGDGSNKPGLQPYICPAGYPTIGHGSIYGIDGMRVTMDHPTINIEQATALMVRDIKKSYISFLRFTKTQMTDKQTAAIVDFIYNLGSGSYRASTLRAVINRGELEAAPVQLRRWVYSGGRRLKGLMRRRAAEIELYCQ